MAEKSYGQNIGIMGGTFNPIHNGHILLAQSALHAENLDKIVFMPSGMPYMKANTEVLDATQRFEMVKLAIEEYPYFVASDIEIKRLGHTYTYETLAHLRNNNPLDNFYFIMGADNLFSIEKWKCPQEIFRQCIMLAAVRNNTPIDDMQEKIKELQNRYKADIRLLPFSDTPISSTQIRRMVANSENIAALLPEKVNNYIIKHNLYK